MLLLNIILVELLNKKIKKLPILTCETLKYHQRFIQRSIVNSKS